MTDPLATPLELPCGVTLPNRLIKTAMSEGLADPANHATPAHEALYARWAKSGVGTLFTGNIQIDPNHLERPQNIVIADDSGATSLARMAQAGRSGGAHFWAQLGHTGRQVAAEINPEPLSPSVVEIEALRSAGLKFARPRAMTEADILHAIDQFAFAAEQVKAAGFTGVTLHGAHGYLISQFLSPRTNLRTDRWGGTPENRARFLIEVLAAVREAVGSDFPLGIKLNSSDFLAGGFTPEDCVDLVRRLNDTSLDLLELSGGSLEQPRMMGITVTGDEASATPATPREAYFVAFARDIKAVAKMPVMVVGGFRSRAAMEAALNSGDLDLIGLARPLIAMPDGPAKLLKREIDILPRFEDRFDPLPFMAWNNMQLVRMGQGQAPDLELTGDAALAAFMAYEKSAYVALLTHRAAKAF